VLIGVTDEDPKLVDEWVAKHKPTYPVVILTDGALENKIGVKFFPTVGVISPGLKLTYGGSSSGHAKPLAEALGESDKSGLYPSVISKVRKYFAGGDVIKAFQEASKIIKKNKDETGWAARYRDYIGSEAQAELDRAEKLATAGFIWAAVEAVAPYGGEKSPIPCADSINKFVSGLEENKLYKKECKGGKAYAAANKLAKTGKYVDAIKAYKSISKSCKGTQIARNAIFEAQDLIDRGMPGFRGRNCEKCYRAKRACDKHAESIKL